MIARVWVIILTLLKFYYFDEVKSFEVNEIDISPLNEALIFMDIVDILKDLNRNVNLHFETAEDSESEETVEDLLSEYQHYLDKAHEQRRIYRINNTKSKVPLLPKGLINKKPSTFSNRGYSHASSYFNPYIPTTALNSPLDLLIPMNSGIISIQEVEREITPEKNYIIYGKQPKLKRQEKNENKLFDIDNTLLQFTNPNETSNVSCLCNSERWPCKCNSLLSNKDNMLLKYLDSHQNLVQNTSFENDSQEITKSTNDFNVRIKVDLQIPVILKSLNKYGKNRDDVNSEEYVSNIKLPAAYFNIPFPFNGLGYSKIIKKKGQVFNPLHKIMIHKKNKLRIASNNKKHRKKLLTFNKQEQQDTQRTETKASKSSQKTGPLNLVANTTYTTTNKYNLTKSNTEVSAPINKSQIDERIFLMVNISNTENETDRHLENSIEIDNKLFKITTIKPLENERAKREIILNNSTNNVKFDVALHNKSKKYIKWKSNKYILFDNDLLYWPSNSSDETVKKILEIKNNTDLFSKRENTKADLNITDEMKHINRTIDFQQAIFRNLDWNDINNVVPTFLEFVGKYINGAITFCSEHVCHSIKCANASCVHRICAPEQLFNHLGHCIGSNKTDSLISMAPIIDLPPNTALNTIDILEEKMLGKLFGKITLCIGTKCVSFGVAKKTLIKVKCEVKSLNKIGHCPSTISNKTA